MMRFLCIESLPDKLIPYRVLNHTFSKQSYPFGYNPPPFNMVSPIIYMDDKSKMYMYVLILY